MMNELLTKIEKLRQQLLSHNKPKQPNEIYVSEIVAFYYPYDKQPVADQLVRGDLYHIAIQNLLKEDCQAEVPLSREFGDYVIRGRADLICPPYIVEIKSSERSYLPGMLQLQIYNYLNGGNNKLLLLYPTLTFDLIPPLSVEEIKKKIDAYIKSKLF